MMDGCLAARAAPHRTAPGLGRGQVTKGPIYGEKGRERASLEPQKGSLAAKRFACPSPLAPPLSLRSPSFRMHKELFGVGPGAGLVQVTATTPSVLNLNFPAVPFPLPLPLLPGERPQGAAAGPGGAWRGRRAAGRQGPGTPGWPPRH